jgi:hypothetical protein
VGRAALWLVVGLFTFAIAVSAWRNVNHRSAIDFYFFWEAAGHVVGGHASAVYLPHLAAAGHLRPLAYPPPFLFLIAPFGLLSFGVALASWLIVTGTLYLVSTRQPLRLALASPAAAYNGLFGQAGFLTSAIMLGGANLVGKRPIVAGLLLGCMVIKPHLAIFVPVALVAAKEWRVFAAAAASAFFLSLAAAAAFGAQIYALFGESLRTYGSALASGQWQWTLLASPYALFRDAGLQEPPALLLHGILAVFAAWLVCTSWREKWESRVAVLAAASMLGSPYLFTYDAVMMVVPLGYLVASGRARWALAVGLLLALPLLGTTMPQEFGLSPPHLVPPNTTSIAALLSLLVIWRVQFGSVSGSHQRVFEG